MSVSVTLSELIALKRYSYPKTKALRQAGLFAGRHELSRRGRGMDFADLRHYQVGDDVRHMEWRVTARTGKPHVKLYQEERERPLLIVTDFSPSMFFGTRVSFKSCVAARLSACIAWMGTFAGDAVSGLLVSEKNVTESISRTRTAGILPLLAVYAEQTERALEKHGVSAHPDRLQEALLRARRLAYSGTTIVLISDFYAMNAQAIKELSALALRFEVLVYHVCDPIELAPPMPGYYAVTNGDERQLLDITNAAVKEAYQHYCEKRVSEISGSLKQLNIPYIQLTAETDLPELVQRTFFRGMYG
jgi:uncharacterized protein (DUF58 family)